MKWLLPGFILIFLLFASPVFSEDFNSSKAYQDYLYNYNLYRSSHDNYLSAKNEHLSYKTLNSQTKALEATREMLKNRDEALRTYLTALRMRLKETTGIINYQQNLEYLKLDLETNWLTLHKDSLSAPTSLEDLFKTSADFEKRYPDTEVLAYQSLGTILSGKQDNIRNQISDQIKKIEDKITEIKNTGESVDKLQQWLGEAKKKVVASQTKQTEAENILKALDADENNKKGEFNNAQAAIGESNQNLKEAASFLTEIIVEIKHEQ